MYNLVLKINIVVVVYRIFKNHDTRSKVFQGLESFPPMPGVSRVFKDRSNSAISKQTLESGYYCQTSALLSLSTADLYVQIVFISIVVVIC